MGGGGTHKMSPQTASHKIYLTGKKKRLDKDWRAAVNCDLAAVIPSTFASYPRRLLRWCVGAKDAQKCDTRAVRNGNCAVATRLRFVREIVSDIVTLTPHSLEVRFLTVDGCQITQHVSPNIPKGLRTVHTPFRGLCHPLKGAL